MVQASKTSVSVPENNNIDGIATASIPVFFYAKEVALETPRYAFYVVSTLE